MADKKNVQAVWEAVFFLVYIILISASTPFILEYLKVYLFITPSDAAFNPIAGWGAMMLPILFIAIASSLPVFGFMRSFYNPEGKKELLSPTIIKISLSIIVACLIILGFLFNSYLRVNDQGITHNKVFEETVVLPWSKMTKAELGLVKKKVTVGKTRSIMIARLTLKVTFPDVVMELYDEDGDWEETVAKIKRSAGTIIKHAPAGLILVPPTEEALTLLKDSNENYQKDTLGVLDYARAELAAKKKN
jgi:hypothetical protein